MSTKLGNIGEEIAKDYLIDNQYTIKKRQYHSMFGEIDIIAKDIEGTIVFCEVKYYKENSLVNPISAINKRKQIKLIKTAEYYLYKNKIDDTPLRFDILIVEKGIVKCHLENVISKSVK
jgi:putative endonuclease